MRFCNPQQRRTGAGFGSWCRRCAPELIFLLCGLIALPASSLPNNAPRAWLAGQPLPAEEEPTSPNSPAEEQAEGTLAVSAGREEQIRVQLPGAQSQALIPALARPRAQARSAGPRSAAELGRNGCGAPLRC